MLTRLLAFATVLLLTLHPALAVALQVPDLPPGLLTVEVDDLTINAQTSPTTNSSTPEISGRTDESIDVLDLAVDNGTRVQFSATIGGSGRFRAVPPEELPDGTYSLYANDALIGTFIIANGTPGPRSPGALLDIARVVPYPADAAESLPSLAFVDGRFFNLSEEAARTAARNPGSMSARELEKQLATAGWLQRYENRLAVPDSEDPARFDVQLTSFVVEYASGADARTAFDSLKMTGATDFPTIGEESQLVLFSGTTPDTGATYQAARLAFRVGPLLVVIYFADLLNREPDLTALQSIATAVAERGKVVADRQAVPLGSMALRLDLDEAGDDVSTQALYEIRAGALTAMFGEAEEAKGERAALLTGSTDAFSISTSGLFTRSESSRNSRQGGVATPESELADGQSSTPVASPPADVSFKSSLFAFPSESDADAWLSNQVRLLSGETAGSPTFSPVPAAPAQADAARVFMTETVQTDGTELAGYRILTRSGNVVAITDIQSAPAVSLRGAVGLVEDQLDCITAQGCSGSASLPGSIFGVRDRPSG